MLFQAIESVLVYSITIYTVHTCMYTLIQTICVADTLWLRPNIIQYNHIPLPTYIKVSHVLGAYIILCVLCTINIHTYIR